MAEKDMETRLITAARAKIKTAAKPKPKAKSNRK